ncbi:sedoheptulose 7-phosphate cyclase [Aspergillus clavatus NRRL 1]|uniref:3-dehydroquinate synthase, putative n=1 Tax=Aspergillus clavatus (strain ATCC 1007 / CBS 513.65 / DSM 816 / NCTC 3887 / NRRL 1 / QM 1276 / 107) TaxID=344612 RepID=A1C9L3_ASPCL|nr:3-dehydroquinate synthase, putative [Aspergillus clavatus NRRL 1]EAW13537.1 3-dehydroquinate synthase, putative [Aspergillus clavatus NRRL 1]
MSDLKATVSETIDGFHVEGYEKIEYDFTFLDGVFEPQNPQLANLYERWGRCLAVMDRNIYVLYGDRMQKYFDHHGLELKIHQTMIGEKAKSLETFTSIVDSMTDFGIIRKEPVLVVGGGLVTDVAGFACAAYRRNTNYIRIPTTVIGLIDASVSIKVAVNYGNYKNRLGAYHAPMHTFLDFGFLRTLPEAQVRNGFAELIKISSCAHLRTFDLLDEFCERLIATKFGRSTDDKGEVKKAADEINRNGIYEMLKLETPNLHEIGLDRVIAYGHTWSPLHELTPPVPLRHGHAISIDMAYSATLANNRGLLSDDEHRRLLNLFSRAGLSMDHDLFNEEILDKATQAILKTRDGLLRAAVPSPLGSCKFLNDVTNEEMFAALRRHKKLMKEYPRVGAGVEAYVDASDTGYTINNKPVDPQTHAQKLVTGIDGKEKKSVFSDGILNGFREIAVNGYPNGLRN